MMNMCLGFAMIRWCDPSDVRMLKDWFGTIDSDCSGSITYDEFVVALEDPSMVSFALEMGIDLPDIKQFFSVLSSNGQRGVDLDTFVVGCIKLKGAAKSMDLMDLVFAHRHALNKGYRHRLGALGLGRGPPAP